MLRPYSVPTSTGGVFMKQTSRSGKVATSERMLLAAIDAMSHRIDPGAILHKMLFYPGNGLCQTVLERVVRAPAK